MEVGHCKDCKWWDRNEQSNEVYGRENGFAPCFALQGRYLEEKDQWVSVHDAMWPVQPLVEGIIEDCERISMITSRFFGCTMFELKDTTHARP